MRGEALKCEVLLEKDTISQKNREANTRARHSNRTSDGETNSRGSTLHSNSVWYGYLCVPFPSSQHQPQPATASHHTTEFFTASVSGRTLDTAPRRRRRSLS